MPRTSASVGQGAQFFTGTGTTSPTYTAVLEMASISTPRKKRESVEATHLKSASDVDEFIPGGTVDPGEIQISGNFIGDATQETIQTLIDAGTVFPWKFTSAAKIGGTALAGTSVLTLTGYGFFTDSGEGPFEAKGKKVDIMATMKATGPITRAIA
ncbi:MAG: hypothetical protein JWN34_2018 [Bryobacterales bacterium]|nr:hypothetical protein [Bryobacterales bacterium]